MAAPGQSSSHDHQAPKRRLARRAGVLLVLAVLVVAVALAAASSWQALHYHREGVASEGCAQQFELDKTHLAGFHWGWWPLPGWVCEFDDGGYRWERRLR